MIQLELGRPLPGTAVEVAPRLRQVCTALPGPPSHVNYWLIGAAGGLVSRAAARQLGKVDREAALTASSRCCRWQD